MLNYQRVFFFFPVNFMRKPFLGKQGADVGHNRLALSDKVTRFCWDMSWRDGNAFSVMRDRNVSKFGGPKYLVCCLYDIVHVGGRVQSFHPHSDVFPSKTPILPAQFFRGPSIDSYAFLILHPLILNTP